MKIGILGTRGIPNNYGGFEQFAEYLSKGLIEYGHDVSVYSTSDHPYQQPTWNNVNLIHIYNPEEKTGTWGQFIYDLLCIVDSRKRKFDLILQLGYTSNSVWGRLLPGKALIITNMDGLEWKRTKYSKKVQRFIKYAEKLAIRTSDYLVADSKGIQTYLATAYHKESEYIPYGTTIFNSPKSEAIHSFNVSMYNYNMLIARMEPENNIETILDGVRQSSSDQPFLVIGKTTNEYGKYLTQKFQSEPRIRFLGSLYDLDLLNNLRYYSNLYFHGHSVGGTNPSLLEAMASNALICAHQNDFNRYILDEHAFYFTTPEDVKKVLDSRINKTSFEHYTRSNISKIENLYLWPKIIKDYETFFRKCMSKHP